MVSPSSHSRKVRCQPPNHAGAACRSCEKANLRCSFVEGCIGQCYPCARVHGLTALLHPHYSCSCALHSFPVLQQERLHLRAQGGALLGRPTNLWRLVIRARPLPGALRPRICEWIRALPISAEVSAPHLPRLLLVPEVRTRCIGRLSWVLTPTPRVDRSLQPLAIYISSLCLSCIVCACASSWWYDYSRYPTPTNSLHSAITPTPVSIVVALADIFRSVGPNCIPLCPVAFAIF